MAKAKSDVPDVMVNKSGATLIFPGGVELARGETVTLSKEQAENAGVQAWIADGSLVAEVDIPAEVAVNIAELKAENEALRAENEALKADLATATAPKQ